MATENQKRAAAIRHGGDTVKVVQTMVAQIVATLNATPEDGEKVHTKREAMQLMLDFMRYFLSPLFVIGLTQEEFNKRIDEAIVEDWVTRDDEGKVSLTDKGVEFAKISVKTNPEMSQFFAGLIAEHELPASPAVD